LDPSDTLYKASRDTVVANAPNLFGRVLSAHGVLVDSVEHIAESGNVDAESTARWLLERVSFFRYITGMPLAQALFRTILFDRIDVDGSRIQEVDPALDRLIQGFLATTFLSELLDLYFAALDVSDQKGEEEMEGHDTVERQDEVDGHGDMVGQEGSPKGKEVDVEANPSKTEEGGMDYSASDILAYLFFGHPGEPWNLNLSDSPLPRLEVSKMKLVQTWSLNLINRRLFVTKTGYMGFAPECISEGDLLCVLFGSGVPLILRKVDGHYILLGQCFALGLMDGEAIELLDQGKRELQTFDVY
jgi:hypothetical protein